MNRKRSAVRVSPGMYSRGAEAAMRVCIETQDSNNDKKKEGRRCTSRCVCEVNERFEAVATRVESPLL
jgi:hypothetical protein